MICQMCYLASGLSQIAQFMNGSEMIRKKERHCLSDFRLYANVGERCTSYATDKEQSVMLM